MKKNGEKLSETLAEALVTGEIPYQAVHDAARAADWFDDAAEAEKELDLALSGIRMFVDDLEGFASEAEVLGRKALAAVR